MNKPTRNDCAKYKTVDQIMMETNLSRGLVMKIAAEADSIYRMKRTVRIYAETFYAYIEREYKSSE